MRIQHIITLAAMAALPLSAQTSAPAASVATSVQQAADYATPAQAVDALKAALTRLCDTLDACTPENSEQSAAIVRECLNIITMVGIAARTGSFKPEELKKAVTANEEAMQQLDTRLKRSCAAFMERAEQDTTSQMKAVLSPEDLDKAFGMD